MYQTGWIDEATWRTYEAGHPERAEPDLRLRYWLGVESHVVKEVAASKGAAV
jgi:hypothetical protein